MANIRCPNCGRDNPDLLDVCQFCQTPLKPDSVLRIGENPTKKNTGELASILPDWLKNIQQQSNDAAEEEAAQAAARPEDKKDEPPDLLAGLASQAGSREEEDVPDWLASLRPAAKPEPSAPSTPASQDSTDFFAQFNQKESEPEPVSEKPSVPPQDDAPPWMSGLRDESTIPFEKDELSEWFNHASGRTEEVVEQNEEQSDMGWGGFDASSASAEKPPTKEEEDLSWLHNLEATARQTGELQNQKPATDWTADFETPSVPSSASQDDLSWLDRLGGIEEPSQPAHEQPAAPTNDLSWLNQFESTPEVPQTPKPGMPQEDLSWLSTLGSPSEPPMDAAPNQPIPPQPFMADSEADLDWLNKLGKTPEPASPAQPFSAPQDQQPSEEEDLSWLANVGKPSAPSEPVAPGEDLSWLNALGGETEPLSTPPFDEAGAGTDRDHPLSGEPEPDWLKSATETPSMPAPGDLSMD